MLFLLVLPVALAINVPRWSAYVSVDSSTTFQEVDGWGCSEAFKRAEDVLGRGGLSPQNQSYVLDLLFDVKKGAGFNILRNGIGSTNNSDVNYMNTIEPVNPGSPYSTPQYVWDYNNTGQFPIAQQAVIRGTKHIYGDAWSAPWFMKTNQNDFDGGYICGVSGESCPSGDWRQAYANYLIQYTRFYRDSGVNVTHLGSYNEPSYNTSYASMLSNGTQAADFIKVLGMTVKREGVDVKLTCCDDYGWDQQEALMAGLQKVGEDGQSAEDFLSVITGHGYASPPTYPLSTTKKTWLTEWADLTGDYTPQIFYNNSGPGEGITWAHHIQTAFVDANVSAFLYWIGAENASSNSALIDMIADEVIPTKRFWTFASFSKFVRPGARRIQAQVDSADLSVSAFINTNGRVAVQIVNNATESYKVTMGLSGKVTPYTTNNEYDLLQGKAIDSQDGNIVGQVPGKSMVSFVQRES